MLFRRRRRISYILLFFALLTLSFFLFWIPSDAIEEPSDFVAQDDTVLTPKTFSRLKTILNCGDRSFEPSIQQRQNYWILYNYVRAGHGSIECHKGVTFAAHADYSFMENLLPVVEKWRNPISLSLHAPGEDFEPTISSIRYIRDCTGSNLVKYYVTFHIYFPYTHLPKSIPDIDRLLEEPYDCTETPPYLIDPETTYKSRMNILFPINLARNIARELVLTHFHLVTDIELYPSPFMPERFLNMIARNEYPLNRTNPRVFPLNIFEIEENQTVPNTKTELVKMLKIGTAVSFHKKICRRCHTVPQAVEWSLQKDAATMEVFHIGKRTGKFYSWEPIFIGTSSDPMYDERLSWDGRRDKMPQGYIMCALDYDFMILSDAFIVHRPGIKTERRKGTMSHQTNMIIKNNIIPELKLLYGDKKECVV
jgi:beta-1,4-glucuronyltransferase 1